MRTVNWPGRSLVVAMVLAHSACYLGAPDDIPCDFDRECPTNFTCELGKDSDFADGLCMMGEPEIDVLGLVVEGEPRRFAFVATVDEPQSFRVRIKNIGTRTAVAPSLALSPLACLEQNLNDGAPLADLEAGAEVEVPYVITLTAASCPSPLIVDWFSTFNTTRVSRGTWNLAFTAPE
jgi:hypothetical protein